VKLHAVHGGRPGIAAGPPQAHHLVLVGPGAHLELVADRRPIHDQRVVAGGGERVGQALENAPAVVADLRSLAVHQDVVAMHGHGVDLGDRLVTQADAQDRDPPLEGSNQVGAVAGVLRRTRAR
jgi:hypothetical protein